MPTIVAKGPLKVVAVLDPEALASLTVPEGLPRYVLTVHAGKDSYTADLNAKSARKAIAAIRALGAENANAILQGQLIGEVIGEAGLTVAERVRKAEPAEAAA